MSNLNPRIYVACLTSYNNGFMHGEWIDANQDLDSIRAEIQAMLASPTNPCRQHYPDESYEEWAIHDYEDFGGLHLDKNEDLEKVAGLATLIAEHGEAFALYAADVGTDDATSENFSEAYQGVYGSKEDFVEEMYSQSHEIPASLQSYIAWDRMARDWFIDDYSSDRDRQGNLHIFRRH